MNIKITDKIGFKEKEVLYLVESLFDNRKPKEGSFDYGFETHGVVGIMLFDLKYPIQVYQTNKRKNEASKIEIVIERHTPIY